MKLLILACAVAFASAGTDLSETDLEAIVHSDETMIKILDCFLGEGPCENDMMSFIKPFINHKNCADCSPALKHIGEKFMKTAFEKFPEKVKKLQQKYDPEGKEFEALMKELAKYDY